MPFDLFFLYSVIPEGHGLCTKKGAYRMGSCERVKEDPMTWQHESIAVRYEDELCRDNALT